MTDEPSEIDALRAALAAAEARAAAAEAKAAEAARERAVLANAEAMIAALKLEIEKLRRALYGTRSERKARLLEQLELQLEELEATATEDDLAAEAPRHRRSDAGPGAPARGAQALPGASAARARGRAGADLLRGLRLGPDRQARRGRHRDAGGDPAPWKVIQTVREKFTCRDCERISQPPAPFHPTPRGWAGPNLLAMILFEKFGQHQPLNRQAERYAREGVELSLSTLADQVGACAAALAPLHAPDRRACAGRRAAARRRHPVPLLAQGQDRRPAGSGSMSATTAPSPAAPRPPRSSATPATGGASIRGAPRAAGAASSRPTPMPASASSTRPDRSPGPVTEALCWAHAPAQVLRARRHRRQRPPRQAGAADLAARAARR